MKKLFKLIFCVLLIGCGAGKSYESESPPQANTDLANHVVTYAKVRELVFAKRCLRCHSDSVAKGDVNLSSFESTISSQVIEPGQPEKSALYLEVIEGRMPPNRVISKQEMDLLKQWIIDGVTNEM